MNARTMPGFTAQRSFSQARGRHAASGADASAAGQRVIAAESVPGGPGNVPSGYSRECKRLPYFICVGNRCWTEYYWECTFRPIARAQ